jgi:hypothetical protein
MGQGSIGGRRKTAKKQYKKSMCKMIMTWTTVTTVEINQSDKSKFREVRENEESRTITSFGLTIDCGHLLKWERLGKEQIL